MHTLKLAFLVALVSLLALMATASETNENEDVIKIEIVGEDRVLVNGTESNVETTWQTVAKFVDPDSTNLYSLEHPLEYHLQAKTIKKHIEMMSDGSEVPITEK